MYEGLKSFKEFLESEGLIDATINNYKMYPIDKEFRKAPIEFLFQGFIWDQTPEGYTFWRETCTEWEEICEAYNYTHSYFIREIIEYLENDLDDESLWTE